MPCPLPHHRPVDWKNSSDARYLGALHLAVLPGEAVMEGHFSGYASDVEVSIGPWKWVRLDPASLPDDGLAGGGAPTAPRPA
jgi:hypothetical protein